MPPLRRRTNVSGAGGEIGIPTCTVDTTDSPSQKTWHGHDEISHLSRMHSVTEFQTWVLTRKLTLSFVSRLLQLKDGRAAVTGEIVRAAGRRCGSCAPVTCESRHEPAVTVTIFFTRDASTGWSRAHSAIDHVRDNRAGVIASARTRKTYAHSRCVGGLIRKTQSVSAHRYNACVLHSPKLHTLCSSPALPVR